MTNQVIDLEDISLVDFFGVNEKNLKFLELLYPKVQLVQRGNTLKIMGVAKDVKEFASVFVLLMAAFEKEGAMNEKTIMRIAKPQENVSLKESAQTKSDILVHGRNGLLVKAQTPSQKLMASEINEKDMLFAIGPAGSGKTYTAVALAVRALKQKQVKRIILTRPAVEAGERLGFLPGDLKDKLDPYLQPLYDALRDMLVQEKLDEWLADRTIEIAPLAFMRGRTLDNAFVILDEAQNSTPMQMKMFLTRMGRNSKFIINGDLTQIDLPYNQLSGLKNAQQTLSNIEGISFIYFKDYDIIRHPLVTQIVNAYVQREQYGKEKD